MAAQMGQVGGIPVLILKEGAQRLVGADARRNNIMAARAISEAVRSTLGPKGIDKMLVDSLGDVTITNDGKTILDEMEAEHPSAKMMVEIGVGVLAVGGAGYALWAVRGRKVMLRRHVLRQRKVRKYLKEE